MLRIVHVGVGPLGKRVLRELVARRFGTVVAAVDPASELAGRPLDEVVPGTGTGLTIQPTLSEDGGWRSADCAIVTTSSSLVACGETFRTLLSAGVDVVSSCEELLYPLLRHAELARDLEDWALGGNARILGTGINPGFLMDALPLFATGVCGRVEAVRAWRVQDASTRRIPFQRKIGATLDVGRFENAVRDGTLRHVGLGESLHFLAHSLGLEVDRWEESIEPIVAERELECGLGRIQPGCAAGVRQVAEAWTGERSTLRLEFRAAIGEPAPYDRVKIEGEPPVDLRIEGGVHGDVATSAMLLNCIVPLRAAKPGLHTMATIAPPRWHAPA